MSIPKRFGAIGIPRFKWDGTAKDWYVPPEFNSDPNISIVWLKSQILNPLLDSVQNPDNLYYEGDKSPKKNSPLRIPSVIETGGLAEPDKTNFINAVKAKCDERGTLICGRILFGSGLGPVKRTPDEPFTDTPAEQWVGGEFLCVMDATGLTSSQITSTVSATYTPGSLAQCQAAWGGALAPGNLPAPGTVNSSSSYIAGSNFTPNDSGLEKLAILQAHKARFKRVLVVMRTFGTPQDILATTGGFSCRLKGPFGTDPNTWPIGVVPTTNSVVGSTQTTISNQLAALTLLYGPLGISFKAINLNLGLANPYEELATICNTWIQEGLDQDAATLPP